jgi:hypothetical protein
MSATRVRQASGDSAQRSAILVASARVELLEQLRTPYEIDPALERPGSVEVRSRAGGLSVRWPSAPGGEAAVAATVRRPDGVLEIPIHAAVATDHRLAPLLEPSHGRWESVRAVTGRDGAAAGSIWCAENGSVVLPFDPDEVLLNYWNERCSLSAAGAARGRLRRVLMVIYYRLRPLLPRRLQIFMRRRFARVQARTRFPRWPIETCVHDFYEFMIAIFFDIAGEPLPCIAPWPRGHTWALVLTHDVEHKGGLAALDPILELERAHGVRSAFNLVPRRYEVELELVRQLIDDGFEVGVHGLYHDGRDLESASILESRLPAIRAAAESWGAAGFRAPALHRCWEWMPLLGFDYDSSCPDTDPYEPQPGGCCTWLPFFNSAMVELPVTLAQDHTLFTILRHGDGAEWHTKARFLAEHGGMALLDTHPDYLVERRVFMAYANFLHEFAGDPRAWHALPREVSAWWRQRAKSSVRRQERRWVVVGPAAGEARIEFRSGHW